MQDILNRINEYDVGGGSNPGTNPTPVPDDKKQDGSWNETKEVNSPKVEGTGLIPVYYNGTSWMDLTEDSTEAEWNQWYDYDTTNKKWANARTADGSMWVWIPRYEYKIDSTTRTIDVRFIKTDVKAGTVGYTTDSTGIVKSSDDYIVHPAFIDDTVNGFDNGGWDKELEGFWVAKYPAGWQNGTDGTSSITENSYTVKKSSVTYETSDSNTSYAGSTASGQSMSYPVFKANNYVYNYISVGDAYKISQDIKNAKAIYGLTEIDSHLQKNSEWGAVAYLAHSKYGLSNAEIAVNMTNKNSNPTKVYALTSPETVTNTSTTQNITGIYDMSGCAFERTATFYNNSSIKSYIGNMPVSISSKYVTLYTETNEKLGDATTETTSWYSDYSELVDSSSPIFERGGLWNSGVKSGIFAFSHHGGNADNSHGFRVVLVS